MTFFVPAVVFFLVPAFAILGFTQCTFSRRNYASHIGLATLGLVGLAQAILGVLGRSGVLGALTDGFVGITTNALLVISIHEANRVRESIMIPDFMLALYAIATSLLVVSGMVLSIIPVQRSSLPLLGPLFHLLSATATIPLLVYLFMVAPSSPTSISSARPISAEAQAPTTPTTPCGPKSTQLTLPLSPSFLSLSSLPPSPSSHRVSECTETRSSLTKTKKYASLDLPSTCAHHETKNSSKNFGLRPATSPVSSREKRVRPRPAPLDLSLQLSTGSRHALLLNTSTSLTTIPTRRQMESPSATSRSKTFLSRKQNGDLMRTARRLWSFLLVAQVAALLAEGLKMCAEVGNKNGQSPEADLSTFVLDTLASVFLVVQVGCVMGALTSYNYLCSSELACQSEIRPPQASVSFVTPIELPSSTYSRSHVDYADDADPSSSNTPITGSFPISVPELRFETDRELDDLARLDMDLKMLGQALNMGTESNLEALDLAHPLAPTSDSSIQQCPSTPPLRVSIKTRQTPTPTKYPSRHVPCRSMSVSVHDGTDIASSLTGGSDPRAVFGSHSNLEPEEIQSSVTFPEPTPSGQIQAERRLVSDQESPKKSSVRSRVQSQGSPSRTRKESTRSLGSSSTRHPKHSRFHLSIASFSTIPSLSLSPARSRLRSISLTAKSRGSFSTATASMATDSTSRKNEDGTFVPVSLSRSSSFCSPRPKRRPLSMNDRRKAEEREEIDETLGLGQAARDMDVDVFSAEYSAPPTIRENRWAPGQRTLSPMPFASYVSNDASTVAQNLLYAASDTDFPQQNQQRPPLRPSRSSTFHIFPNFDALAGLGSLGSRLSRGLSGNRSPTPTRVLSPGAGGGVVGMRSPTPMRMGGIKESTSTGNPQSPTRMGLDLVRIESRRSAEEEDDTGSVERLSVDGKKEELGWKCVGVKNADNPYAFDLEMQDLKTPMKMRPKGKSWPSPSRIPKPTQSPAVGSPGSLKSDNSSDLGSTPTSQDLQTPRTPFAPLSPASPLHSRTHSPQAQSKPPLLPLGRKVTGSMAASRSSLPLPKAFAQFGSKQASPPPSAFSGFIDRHYRIDASSDVFDEVPAFSDPDPFAGPGFSGAVVRESQVSLLNDENIICSGYGQTQTATRMSAWGNLTLPVPKERRNPGIGLRRALSDDTGLIQGVGARCPTETAIATNGTSKPSPGWIAFQGEGPESPSACSQEIATDSRPPAGIVKGNAQGSEHSRSGAVGNREHDVGGAVDNRDSYGSLSLVPVEEALLAQRLLRRLNRRADVNGISERNRGRQKHKRKKASEATRGEEIVGQGTTGRNAQSSSGDGSAETSAGSGSFLLNMARGKFLGYGWSS